ncbi:MAG: hypothetical protein JWO67_3147 [Streptosporangiaceae bacterium]|nr:hypothetical protein [Streptosporangiaceae bacterium]
MTHAPLTLVVTNNVVQLQPCRLYSHSCVIVDLHHICPKSWWITAGVPIATPMIALCPSCHGSAHASIDAILANRDVSLLPARCVKLARQALTIAAANGLTPAPTL